METNHVSDKELLKKMQRNSFFTNDWIWPTNIYFEEIKLPLCVKLHNQKWICYVGIFLLYVGVVLLYVPSTISLIGFVSLVLSMNLLFIDSDIRSKEYFHSIHILYATVIALLLSFMIIVFKACDVNRYVCGLIILSFYLLTVYLPSIKK